MKVLDTAGNLNLSPEPHVSIIVPFYYKVMQYLQELLEWCKKLDYEKYGNVVLVC